MQGAGGTALFEHHVADMMNGRRYEGVASKGCCSQEVSADMKPHFLIKSLSTISVAGIVPPTCILLLMG